MAVIYAAVSWVTLSRDNILAELIAIILNGITVIQVLIALYQKSDAQQARLKGKQETDEENPYQEVENMGMKNVYEARLICYTGFMIAMLISCLAVAPYVAKNMAEGGKLICYMAANVTITVPMADTIIEQLVSAYEIEDR